MVIPFTPGQGLRGAGASLSNLAKWLRGKKVNSADNAADFITDSKGVTTINSAPTPGLDKMDEVGKNLTKLGKKRVVKSVGLGMGVLALPSFASMLYGGGYRYWKDLQNKPNEFRQISHMFDQPSAEQMEAANALLNPYGIGMPEGYVSQMQKNLNEKNAGIEDRFGVKSDPWQQYLKNVNMAGAQINNGSAQQAGYDNSMASRIASLVKPGGAEVQGAYDAGARQAAAEATAGTGTDLSGMVGAYGSNTRAAGNLQAQGNNLASYLMETLGVDARSARDMAAADLASGGAYSGQLQTDVGNAKMNMASVIAQMQQANDQSFYDARATAQLSPITRVSPEEFQAYKWEYNSLAPYKKIYGPGDQGAYLYAMNKVKELGQGA